MNRIVSRYLSVFLTLFLCFFCVLATGCEDSTGSAADTGYVKFEESGAGSRGFTPDYEEFYSTGDLYWAYVAVKKDGLHTVGESKVTSAAASTGKIVTVDSKNYELRPVKKDYGTGFDANLGPFSFGDWVFKVYGFLGFDESSGTFTDLVYTGNPVTSTVQINKSDTAVALGFKLTDEALVPAYGKLSLGSLYYAVPTDKIFYKNSVITVTVTDKASGTEIFKCTGNTGSSDAVAGTKIHLSSTITSTVADKGKDGKFTPGLYNFKVTVVYQKGVSGEEETITESTPREFPIIFTKGAVTMIYGDINDVTVGAGDMKDKTFGVAVCYSGTSGGADYVEYSSLAKGLESGKTPLTLLCNVDYCGVANPTVDVTVNTNGYFVRSLALGSAKAVTFVPGTSRSYKFSGSGKTLNSFRTSASDAYVDTSGGSLTVNAANDNVFFTGSSDSVTVTSVKNNKSGGLGFHCGGKVTALSITSGFLSIESYSSITTLTNSASSATAVTLKGSSTAVVGNADTLRDGTGLSANAKASFVKIYLDGNGGTGTEKTLYGIDGMSVKLPANHFTGPCAGYAQFLRWGTTVYDGLGKSYTVNTSVPVSYDFVLYAIWGLPVGGSIFYVDGTSIAGAAGGVLTIDGRTFKFYKSDLTAVGSLTSITAAGKLTVSSSPLKDAAYYTVVGFQGSGNISVPRYYKPDAATAETVQKMNRPVSKDNIYVLLGKSYSARSNLAGCTSICQQFGESYNSSIGLLETCAPLNMTAGSTQMKWTDDHKKMGMGKGNTAYILNAASSGKTGTGFGASDWLGTGSNLTMWQIVKYVNTQASGYTTDGSGWGDWYVPSAYEAVQLRLCGATGVQNHSSTLSVWNYTTSCIVCVPDGNMGTNYFVSGLGKTGCGFNLIRSF